MMMMMMMMMVVVVVNRKDPHRTNLSKFEIQHGNKV
jgi:hypothetical protein